jgi:hypothetical protein
MGLWSLQKQIQPVVDDLVDDVNERLDQVRADVREEVAELRPWLRVIALSLLVIAWALAAGLLVEVTRDDG